MIFNQSINETKQEIYNFLNEVEKLEELNKIYKDQYGYYKFIENNVGLIDTTMSDIGDVKHFIKSLMFLIDLDKKITEQNIIFPEEILPDLTYFFGVFNEKFNIFVYDNDYKNFGYQYCGGKYINYIKNEYDKVTRNKELQSKLAVKDEITTQRRKI